MRSDRRVLTSFALVATVPLLGCAPRLEPPEPQRFPQIEVVADWSRQRAAPYGIPERQLMAYAYAALQVESQSGCTVGWPTIAAIGQVASDHGRVEGSEVGEDGLTTEKLRGLEVMQLPPIVVSDTDSGATDGDDTQDVAVGPMQIMPSRWEQFAASPEPGRTPDPDNIDDAALTAAHILCAAGDPSNPEGWDEGVKRFFYSPEAVMEVHRVASELSR